MDGGMMRGLTDRGEWEGGVVLGMRPGNFLGPMAIQRDPSL
jgi:hypothetical protein